MRLSMEKAIEFVENLEKYHPIQKYWDESNERHRQEKNTENYPYSYFRGVLIRKIAEIIEALQQENKRLKKERDQAIRDIDKGNCRSCVYDGKKICYGNMHGKDREVAKEQGLPYCIGWQWRGLEGRE